MDIVRLEGHDQIREFIDPLMSRTYYFKHIVPSLRPILFRRSYRPRLKAGETPGGSKPRYWTYTNLVQIFLLKAGKV